MLLAFSGLNRAMSEFASARPAGRLFGTFDASGKWAGASAGIVAGWLVHRYGLSLPFFMAATASTLALATAAYSFRTTTVKGETYVAASDS